MGTLNKPTVGSTGWGSDVNENFDTTMESFAGIAGGRLTVSSSDPVPTTDQSGTTLYYLPYKSSKIALWNTTDSAWGLEDIGSSGVGIGTGGLSSSTNYDVFLYDNSGTLTLELVAWSSGTARATAISRKDGVWVKGSSGSQSPERRYLGTIRTVYGPGFKDAEQERFVWNVDNRIARTGATRDASNWSATNTGWAAMHSGASYWKYEFVRGLDEDPIEAYLALVISSSGYYHIGVGLDSTSSPDTTNKPTGYRLGVGVASLAYRRTVALGYHYLNAVDKAPFGSISVTGSSTDSLMRMTIVG